MKSLLERIRSRHLTRLMALAAAIIAIIAFGQTGPAHAATRIIYVDADATGANDGTSWEDAFTELSDALDDTGTPTASDPVEIWVAEGVYTPDTTGLIGDAQRTATFALQNHVAIYGGFVGVETDVMQRNPAANQTILSGDIGILADINDNIIHVVTAISVDETAILDGVNVQLGAATSFMSFTSSLGGGLYNVSASPVIRNVTFQDNDAVFEGGAIHVSSGSPLIEDSTFTNNEAIGAGSRGGAIHIETGEAIVRNSTFTGNTALGSGGAIELVGTTGRVTIEGNTFIDNVAQTDSLITDGGAINNTGTDVHIVKNVFVGNEAAQGGAIYNDIPGSGQALISHNRFVFNKACTLSGMGCTDDSFGGAIFNNGSSPAIVNNAFIGNDAYVDGGAIYNDNSSPLIVNATFTLNNVAVGDGSSLYNANNSDPEIVNSILWGDFPGDTLVLNAAGVDDPTFQNSIVEGSGGSSSWSASFGVDNGGNLDQDPLFVDADGASDLRTVDDNDARLQNGSPAIDAGLDSALPDDLADLDGDGNTSENIPLDLNLTRRERGSAVDMGAYETGPLRYYVSPSGNDSMGVSWNSAFNDIQDALAAAAFANPVETTTAEVWVEAGTYAPGTYHAGESFTVPTYTSLLGGFAGDESPGDPRDPITNLTILTGDNQGDDSQTPTVDNVFSVTGNDNNADHVLYVAGESTAVLVDGFTVTAGYAALVEDDDCFPTNVCGGGMLAEGSVTVSNMVFVGNFASGDGGGFASVGSNEVHILDSTFEGNRALDDGGGIYFRDTNSATVTRNHIMNNSSASDAGGLMISLNTNVVAYNNRIEGNRAAERGGGVFLALFGTLELVNNVLAGNVAVEDGGGLLVFDPDVTVQNNTFAANQAGIDGGGIHASLGGGSFSLSNNVLWGNAAAGSGDQASLENATITISESVVEGGTPAGFTNGGGIETGDPLFLRAPSDGGNGFSDDPATSGTDESANDDYGDLRVAAGGSAVDAGANADILPDAGDADNDGNTAEDLPIDVAGNPRIIGGTVDIGAYELDPSATPGITLDPADGLAVDEVGSTDTYTVVLDALPIAPVTVNIQPGTQCQADAASLVFTAANWDQAQTVTVNAVPDNVEEANPHICTITHTADSTDGYYDSDSPGFAGFTGGSGADQNQIDVSITDDDEGAPAPGITLDPAGGLAVDEVGSTDTYTVVLDAMPGTEVTVTVQPDAQCQADVAFLIFTAANWDQAQTVTVNAVPDNVEEANPHICTITHTADSIDGFYDSDSPDFAGFTGGSGADQNLIDVSITDDDEGAGSGNLLQNPSFESVLSEVDDWQAIFKGGFNGPLTFGGAVEGTQVLVLDGTSDNGIEGVEQFVTYSGSAGDTVTFTFYIGGRNTGTTGQIGAQIFLLAADDSVVNACTRVQAPRANTFPATQLTCEIVASADFETIRVRLGGLGVKSGFYGFDAVELTVE